MRPSSVATSPASAAHGDRILGQGGTCDLPSERLPWPSDVLFEMSGRSGAVPAMLLGLPLYILPARAAVALAAPQGRWLVCWPRTSARVWHSCVPDLSDCHEAVQEASSVRHVPLSTRRVPFVVTCMFPS